MTEIKSPEKMIRIRGNELYEAIDNMSGDDAKNYLAFAIGYIHARVL